MGPFFKKLLYIFRLVTQSDGISITLFGGGHVVFVDVWDVDDVVYLWIVFMSSF